MNINLLIDAVVRQTTVFIAHLATAAGTRAPLAHVANQVFLDLVHELRAQGVGRKVIADMFGMALRTYHGRIQRLSESVTERGRTVWEAVLEYVRAEGMISRGEVLHRFRHDDEDTVRAVLNDLVESGLVFKAGRGDRTRYRAADPEEMVVDETPEEGQWALVWITVNQLAPTTFAEIQQALPLEDMPLQAALDHLCAEGRVAVHGDGAEAIYTCDACVVAYHDPVGWEAAILDHYQAMVTALCIKLRAGRNQAAPADANGGSTYGFDVHLEHPLREEVLGMLASVRRQASELRQRVEAHNAAHPLPEHSERVMFYVGQSLRARIIERQIKEER